MTTSDELGNFCHDNYEHPLLLCEEKKRLVERKNAEDSLRMWRRRKAEEVVRKEKDKQEYYELFLKHCPWGRPGGGAPNVDVRRKDITAIGLHSTPTISTIHRLNSLQLPCRYSDYFAQRKKCHDPIAAYHQHHHLPTAMPPRIHVHPHTHGHAHAHAHAHAHGHTVHHVHPPVGGTVTICERDVKGGGADGATQNGHVDIEVRYKQNDAPRGKPLLEKIVVTESAEQCPQDAPVQAAAKASSQKKKLAAKMEKPPSKEPWGKAGPGGKPWRSPKAVGSSFMKSLGWTNKEMLKDLDQDNPATPAEKPTFRKTRPTKKLQRCCDLCTCNCPAMMAAANSTLKPLSKAPQQQQQQQPQPQQQNSPSKAQKRTTKFAAIKQQICPRFARRCGGDNAPTTATTATTDVSCVPGGGIELVPLLARRRANNRPISLSSTDVTKRTPSKDRLSTAVDVRYLHDLNTQISQKRRSIGVAQQLEKDLCQRHFRTFDTFWGRPGHGAPGEIKTKLKLDNLLYGVHSGAE